MWKLFKALAVIVLLLSFVSCNPATPGRTDYQIVLDTNNNWQRDRDEKGLSDVTMTLIDEAGQTLDEAVSDAQGYVSFEAIPEHSRLFSKPLNDNQVLRCQPYSDHSVCQIMSAFEEYKVGNVLHFNTKINHALNDVVETSKLLKAYQRTLSLGQDIIGLRFEQVLLPEDITLTRAYLKFIATEAQSNPADLVIETESSGDTKPFSSSDKPSQRQRNTTQVLWKPTAWTNHQEVSSPDLSNLIKQTITHPDWKSGQAMSFFITGSGLRSVKSFENASASAVELVLEYQLPAPPSDPNNFASTASASRIVLSWDKVDTATSYKLERKPYGGNYSALTTLSTTSYTDSTISPDTPYVYRLQAINGGGASRGIEHRVTTPPTGITGNADAYTKGMFGPVTSWPLVATHAALLPDGRIISWYSNDRIGTYRDSYDQQYHHDTIVDLWNYKTNQHSEFNNPSTDLFCAGWTVLNNGQFLVAGGNLGTPNGSNHINFFNPVNNTWSRGPDMAAGRWYPSVTKLANGEVLISGGTNEVGTNNQVHEVYQVDGRLRELSSANTNKLTGFEHYYPWFHVAPNGKVFYSGASREMAYLDPSGTGKWEETYPRDTRRQYGSSVMYEPGKILVMGGGGTTSATKSRETAITINLNNGVAIIKASSMHFARTHLNATLLANGHIFVNGGNAGINFDDKTSVYDSEIWNPETGQWTLGAKALIPRNYHASALLLPDGTVWTAGGGGCGDICNANHLNYEIYYPPYLFEDGSGKLATRPQLITVPSEISFNQTFSVTTPDAQDITAVNLVAIGATTHAFNMNQRFISLEILDKTTDTLSLIAPASGNLAPPGFYMLFLINSEGIPSVAKISRLD